MKSEFEDAPKKFVLSTNYVKNLNEDYEEYNSIYQWLNPTILKYNDTMIVSGKVEGLKGVYRVKITILDHDKCEFYCSCPLKCQILRERFICCKHSASLCNLFTTDNESFKKLDLDKLKIKLFMSKKEDLVKILSKYVKLSDPTREILLTEISQIIQSDFTFSNVLSEAVENSKKPEKENQEIIEID
jgi:hypothetical protein